jgi:CheY-like chemotaxis protein
MDLNRVISGIVTNISLLASDKGIAITMAPSESLSLFIDPQRFEQIVENLLTNAVKYSPPGSQITIAITTVQENGSPWAKIAITDQGPGIAKEHISTLFDKFTQVEDTGPEGFGLGLSIASKFAKLHRGHLEVESAPGFGSTFSILMPFPQTPTTTLPIKSIKKVLIVDDDADIRDFLNDILTENGWAVAQASDGDLGMVMFEQFIPDLVISDLRMPNTDGFEFVQMIKQKRPDIHVILTTGYYQDLNFEEARKHFKALAIVHKPFDEKDIINLLD